jgi:hypothetical protein
VPALAPPAIVPNGGTFFSKVNVTLQGPDPNAVLYYTLDGTLPTTNSLQYSGPFSLAGNAVVSANAFETNFINSIAATALFIVQPLQFTSGSFLSDGEFQLQFAGAPGSNYVLQASTNLLDWTPLSTNPAQSNLLYLLDPKATNFPTRFYRVLQQ